MASLPFAPLLLNLLASLIFLLLISPSHSLKCTSQTFTDKKLYTNCTDLPYLSAYLHWTYDSTKSSLSIAFIAPPAKSNGWIAWAINPTGTGMAGAQSLIAFKQSNGSMTVNTYNISSYSSIVKSKIAFDVPEKSAEYSGGVMKIFATLRLPEGHGVCESDLHLTMNKCDDQSGKQDAKEQEMECLVVGGVAVSEPGETKSFREEKISTSSMFETDASVPEIEKIEKQDAEAQASNDLILQDALLKPWWTDMNGRFWMLFFTDIEVDEDVEQEDKPGVRNLHHLCVLQEAKQSSKSPFHLVIAPSLHFQLGRIQ
ncbi:hypothetical protein HYC85_006371 [Camellia sinensis]|uniref:DOMON domain-containing protein n=1 Tax=Camellia sinensis TaxID=4442 RepID=A0A7J7HLS8_CAMSI|nr:hypothetical protein HYC85_006371 [Camellia sinensis]